MERDFMGLGSRDSNVFVKEEAVEECQELDFLAISKASAIQWPSLNKAAAPPHFTAFEPTTEKNIAKVVPSAELQKVDNGPRGTPFSITNQAISAPMGYFRSHFGGSVQNFAGVTTKQQSVVGSQVLRPQPIHPSLGSVAETTETRAVTTMSAINKGLTLKHQKSRFNFKPSESLPQLTIFYGGTVNVFDNISPEKAQAIMFLAGNVSAKVAQPRPQTQPAFSKQGGIHLSPQLANTTPTSGLLSPISISSHPIVQSSKDSRSKDDVTPIKPLAGLGTPKMPSSTTVVHSAVPQARKASLARFLEKRKERVISSAPYNTDKTSLDCATTGSNNP